MSKLDRERLTLAYLTFLRTVAGTLGSLVCAIGVVPLTLIIEAKGGERRKAPQGHARVLMGL